MGHPVRAGHRRRATWLLGRTRTGRYFYAIGASPERLDAPVSACRGSAPSPSPLPASPPVSPGSSTCPGLVRSRSVRRWHLCPVRRGSSRHRRREPHRRSGQGDPRAARGIVIPPSTTDSPSSHQHGRHPDRHGTGPARCVSVDSLVRNRGVARRSRGSSVRSGSLRSAMPPSVAALQGMVDAPQGVMPAFLQMAASEPLQSWSAETSPPATVAAMLRAVTASGVSRTEERGCSRRPWWWR